MIPLSSLLLRGIKSGCLNVCSVYCVTHNLCAKLVLEKEV